MNLYHKKQRWKIALLGAAILMVVVSIWYSYKLVDKIQQREVDRIQQWAEKVRIKSRLVHQTNKAFEELSETLAALQERDLKMVELWVMAIEEVNKPIDDYSFVVKILGEVSTVPMIVTDMNDKVVSSYNMAFLDTLIQHEIESKFAQKNNSFKDSLARAIKNDSLNAFIPVWKKQNEPIEMDLYQSEKQRVYYIDSVFYKNAELSKLKYSRDSLVASFSNELVANEYMVPVVFIDSESRELLATNITQFDTLSQSPSAKDLSAMHDSIMVDLGTGNTGVIYFEHSPELRQMKYFPIIQFGMIGLFILIAYLVFSTFRKAEQDQVWVGMAKETAHQLGTPISSLMAWNELLISQGTDKTITQEIQKDIDRLNTVTNRFSKIGSEAILQDHNVIEVVQKATEYLKTRISSKVNFIYEHEGDELHAKINPALLEWVIENIVKNAIDATEGTGSVKVFVHPFEDEIFIDITDNGKGIPANKLKTVFRPGYTTKMRGWGLGLSLVKRIIEDFHRGKVFVLKSEPNVETTFRISLKQI